MHKTFGPGQDGKDSPPTDKPYIDLGGKGCCIQCKRRYCICEERQDGRWENHTPIILASGITNISLDFLEKCIHLLQENLTLLVHDRCLYDTRLNENREGKILKWGIELRKLKNEVKRRKCIP